MNFQTSRPRAISGGAGAGAVSTWVAGVSTVRPPRLRRSAARRARGSHRWSQGRNGGKSGNSAEQQSVDVAIIDVAWNGIPGVE